MAPILRRWVVFCVIAVITLYFLFNLGANGRLNHLRRSSSPTLHSFKWKDVPQRYPVASMIELPSGPPTGIPRIQHTFEEENAAHKLEREARQRAVKEAFERSWSAYKKYAWLHDEVAPVSGGFKDTFGGWGATLVDTLDTLWIMGMKKEFEGAIKALKQIDFTQTPLDALNVFETNIRYLGGFLGAYDISNGKYPVLLEKAIEVGEMLYVTFDTPNRMPVTRWEWKPAASGVQQVAGDSVLSAELGSLTLEFTRLSQLTGNPKYFATVQRISDEFDRQQNMTRVPGLWPVVINARKLDFTEYNTFTFGGMSDSLYEYLPKQHMMLGGLTNQYRKMYENAVEAAKKYLFFRPMNKENRDVLLSGSAVGSVEVQVNLDPYAQHLACFAGGMVGIGAQIFGRPDDLVTARKLVDGCMWAYEVMPNKIMPETFHTVACNETEECSWDQKRWVEGVIRRQLELQDGKKFRSKMEADKYIEDSRLPPGFTQIDDSRYILRPEAIESMFILYRITGDTTLQDKAWEMFQSIVKLTNTPIAYSAVDDVTQTPPLLLDSMESFWTAETLKYFYLIFSDPELVSLDEFVLNTEAHTLRRPRR